MSVQQTGSPPIPKAAMWASASAEWRQIHSPTWNPVSASSSTRTASGTTMPSIAWSRGPALKASTGPAWGIARRAIAASSVPETCPTR